MSTDPYPSQSSTPAKKLSWFTSLIEHIKGLFSKNEPEDRKDIQDVLNTAHAKDILDDESYTMILGSMSFAEKRANDIMVPRSRMEMIDISLPISEIVPFVIETAHSRFPVFDDERDNIIGLLLAKDLLRYLNQPDLELRSILRPIHFVPETKQLDQLLKEFKALRSHLAMVIDEYGSLTGLVTMEDILEQIVGNIEDEYDKESEQTIFPEADFAWRMMGRTTIEEFNKIANSHIPTDEHDTIGGWLSDELDHIPQHGETYHYQDLQFQVLRANERYVLWVHVRRTQPDASNSIN